MDTSVQGQAEAAQGTMLAKVGFVAGQIVQEFAWDDDVDEDLRLAIEGVVGSPLEDESYHDGADAVLVWFRADDGDLVDTLVDALTIEGSSCCALRARVETATWSQVTSRTPPSPQACTRPGSPMSRGPGRWHAWSRLARRAAETS